MRTESLLDDKVEILHLVSEFVDQQAAALEDSLRYARERKAFGVPIRKHQSISNYLAETVSKLAAARRPAVHVANALKVDQRAIDPDTIRVHGGYGYSTEFDVEHYFRDVPLLIVGQGTSGIQKNVIAPQLVRRGKADPV